MLSVFEFNSNEIRVVDIDGQPWWVAKDICTVLEIVDVSQACKKLDDDEKDTYNIRTLGGNQDTLIVSEPGLYSLVLTSRKPQAKQFKRWLTHVVIPSIRKTGQYSITTQPQQQLPDKDARYNAETAKMIADIDNPILKAALAQQLAEEMGCKSLPPAESDRIVAVNVRASELGISQSLITESGQKGYWSLGSVISRHFTPEGKVPLGSYLVNAYKISEELDKAILDYFEL